MQTSVESEAPRPAVLRSISNESISINREVSIISNRTPTPSIIPPTVDEHAPIKFVPGVVTVAGPGSHLNRWSSKISDKSWRHSRETSSQTRRAPQDPSSLDNCRESTKALADFLITREPPPNNFMSVPSDDEESIYQFKRTAFRLFGKHRKKTKSLRLMQLPDSAVAAQTRSGARHIAISIPMQYDHPYGGPQGSPNPLRSHPTARQDSRGTVTILKPVAEVRESASWYHASDQKSSSGLIDGEKSPINPMFPRRVDAPGVDATRIMSTYHLDTTLQQRQPRVKLAPSTKLAPQRSQKSYVAVSPIEIHRQDSQRTDPQHLERASYSQMPFATIPRGHSPQVSSGSTAPSATFMSTLKLDLPPRSSSIFHAPKVVQEELARASKIDNEKVVEEPPISPKRSGESLGTSPSPPAIFGIAVRGYDASPVGRPQVVRNPTPKSQPHLSTPKQLPNAPVAHSSSIPRPSNSPPFRTRNLTIPRSKDGNVRRVASSRDGIEESILVTRQNRQERVKARKLRDLESLRSESGSSTPLSESRGTNISDDPTQSQAYITAPPPRNSKRGVTNAKNAAVNTLSPIILVANLPPSVSDVSKSDLPFQTTRKEKAETYSPESTIQSPHTQTPPRSIVTSFTSDSDVSLPASSTPKRRSPTQSLRSSMLDTRRQERRAKRNMSLREKEMDARLSKIENDNLLLLQALGGIARSFGEISRIGRDTGGTKERRGRRLLNDSWSPGAEGKGWAGEVERMEPVVSELQVLAPSIGREGHTVRKERKEYDNDDYDDEDGAPILG